MDINKEFEKLVEEFEKEWHDGHEPQGIDDQYVEEMEDGEEVEEAFSMRGGDKKVVDAFYDKETIKQHGASILTTDGKTLTKVGMGGQDIAKWVNGKIKIVAVSDVKSTEQILRYMKKSIPSGVFEEVELEEKKSHTGYELYHKDFSSAIQHAIAHAKKKGHIVDPKEIDDKVATGPKKPSSGKTNRYALKAGRKTVQIQIANLDNKRYELNMYIEDYDKNQLLRVKHDEALIAEAGDICALNRGVLRSKSMQAVWEKKCAPKLNNQTLGENKMEKLVDTVRKVLVGEGEGDQAEYQKKRKAVAKKFGVESCSALKDEAKRKECYNALDKAHVADHEEQVELKKMNKEEVEVKKKVTEGVDLKKLKKEYEKNEDKNNHTENYLLLAKAFGTSSEVKKVQEIMKRNQKQGSTSKSDMDWMYKNINPYYDKIRNEEVEIDEKFAGWIAFYNKDKLEIKPKKGVIDSLYDAKQAAIKHFKVPKSKQGLLAIEPAHEEVKVEKTISKLFSHVRKLMSK